MSTNEKTLVKKLAEVMNEVGRIPKAGFNDHFKYKFVREADLVEKLSELLAARNIFITSSTKGIETIELSKVTKMGTVAMKMGILRVDYTFHDGDSGETLTQESVGEIDQDGGKGLYKALTGAMKYFLMKNFLIATGDDPEQATQKPEVSAPKLKGRPDTQLIMEALTPCKDVKNVETIWKRAMAHKWTPDELKDLTECKTNVLARIEGKRAAENIGAAETLIGVAPDA